MISIISMSESPERVESVAEQEPTQPERTPSPERERSPSPERERSPSPELEDTGSLEQLEPASTPPQSPDAPNEEVRTVPSRPTHLFPSKSDSPVLDTDRSLNLNEGETSPHDSTTDVIAGLYKFSYTSMFYLFIKAILGVYMLEREFRMT